MSGAWHRNAVVYQIYPRSFQDSNGDGIGDLHGIRARLDYIAGLGVDAIWLSPMYPSPLADGGYDVSDYTDVDPRVGTLADWDALVEAAHERGLRVLLDLIPSHTSIEHAWFREHPHRYVWSDRGPPNNWLSAFGGPAWSHDDETGRWYLHSYYPEQPDLDWRNPEVRAAIADVIRFWLDRGADGFRVDAVDRIGKDPALRDDPPATGPWLLPLQPQYGTLRHVHSRNAPDIGTLLRALRDAARGAVLVGEVFRPTAELPPYLDCFDLVFAFEFMFASWDPESIARVVPSAASLGRVAWVLGNHDFSRLATRLGAENTRLAAMLQLTLPGTAFVYQGDEIGLRDGPGSDPPFDRAGRDGARHPMQWTPARGAGFTDAEPWLAPVDPERVNVEDQLRDPGSLLELYRRLIGVRKTLDGPLVLIRGDDDLLAYRRGDRVVALNFAATPRAAPVDGELVLSTDPDAVDAATLPARGGSVILTSQG